jgi:hypothetical protein
VAAIRRGAVVDVSLTVPAANTDGMRPADLERVEVYALTDPEGAGAEDVVATGTRVASIDVRAPRNPDVPIDPDDPESLEKLLEPTGLDQGATTSVRDALEAAALVPGATRAYAVVGISTRGRRGPAAPLVAVPLDPAPPTPSRASVRYDEAGVTLSWPAAGQDDAVHVYARPPVPPEARAGDTPPPDVALTTKPLAAASFVDPRVTWDVERCYVLRTVRVVSGLVVESDASPPACVTPVDTFPPPAPTGLDVLPGQGTITLVWDPSPAADWAGFIVLRAEAPSTTLAPITPAPIASTTYRDIVPAGTRFVYAVQAVDGAGNRSAPSVRIEESALR